MRSQNHISVKRSILFCLLFLPEICFAGTLITTSGGSNRSMKNVVIPDSFPDDVYEEGIKVRMSVQCFGTNNRFVPNPLAPNSKVKMTLKLKSSSKTFDLTFPASVAVQSAALTKAAKSGIASLSSSSLPEATTITNFIEFPLKGVFFPMGVEKDLGFVQTLKFDQITNSTCTLGTQPGTWPNSGACNYAGINGPLKFVSRWSVSASKNVLNMIVAFPGQDGFCGGFHSPLMLFFSKEMPEFKGESDFPLNPDAKLVHWVEPNSPGYFLVLDSEHSGNIVSAEQLFGKNKNYSNGFKALKALDSNHDGKIDKRDSKFPDLALWNDKNGDGKSDSSEIRSLASAGVVSIDLNYRSDGTLDFGGRATAREYSPFKFKDPKSGKIKQGTVYDVWFSTKEAR
jgi:hypothetical protein